MMHCLVTSSHVFFSINILSSTEFLPPYWFYRSSPPEVFLAKGVLKTWVGAWVLPVNLLHIFRTPFPKMTSGRMLLVLFCETFRSSNRQMSNNVVIFEKFTLRKKCPYSELFWSVFSRVILVSIFPGKIRTRITPNTDAFQAVLGVGILSRV